MTTITIESALQYYGYADRTPAAWCLAVDKHSAKSRFKIDYPRVKPHYIPKEQMEMGVEQRDTGLCVKDPQKNVPRLMEYAKLLGTENKLRKGIGVWL